MKSFTICMIALLHGIAASIDPAPPACKTVPGVDIQFKGVATTDGVQTTYECERDVVVNEPDNIDDPGGKPEGGTGAPYDPIDFGGSKHCFTPCEIIYIPYLKKYARFTSSRCKNCDNACKKKRLTVVVWIGASDDEVLSQDARVAQRQCMQVYTSEHLQPIVRGDWDTINRFPVQTIPLFDSTGCHQNTYPPPDTDICPPPEPTVPGVDNSFSPSSRTNPALSQGNGAVENPGLSLNPFPQSPDSFTANSNEDFFQLPAAPDSNYVIPAFKSSLLSPPSLNLGIDDSLITAPKKVASSFSSPDDGTTPDYSNQGGPFGTFPAGLFGRRRRRAVKT